MSELEASIRSSYSRLRFGNTVYLLRSRHEGYYDELPNPESVQRIYKATVVGIDTVEFSGGANIVDWPDLVSQPQEPQRLPNYSVSPRELFLTREMLAVLEHRTRLPRPRPKKLNQYLESKTGRFRAVLASEMARVVLERFEADPRANGKLVKKR